LQDLNLEMASFAELQEKMNTGKGVHFDEYIDKFKDLETGTFDLDALIQGYEDLGFSAAKAIEMVNSQV